MFTQSLWPWLGFILFIIAMLALDLGLLQRKPHAIGMKEALVWFGAWVALAMVFNVGVILFHARGPEAGLEFFTGFLVEKSLSIDNIFVFLLIFDYFRVPSAYQHKVLFWGIVGAIVLRVIFITGGLALMERFHWMIYVFGGLLLVTGIAMMRRKEKKIDPEKNWAIRAFRRFFPVTERFEGNRFFLRRDGRLWATPLFLVLLAIESSDIIFAVDSIPAIFAITPDPFLVFTSNIFAMLGLRALYFAVSGFMQMFHFLRYGFASIVVILGVKMLVSDVYKVPIALSLVLIIFILLLCVIVSLLRPRLADLKPLFERTEKLGLIPFRRLLLIENIIDLADLTVRDAMRERAGVHSLRLDIPWEENLRLISETRFSRYPLVESKDARPIGIVHLKDIPFAVPDGAVTGERLRQLARTVIELREDFPLEEALARFQRRSSHLALVVDGRGEWTGIITLEDVLEELVGKIGDEFDAGRAQPSVSLAGALTPGRVILELSAGSMDEAIREIIGRIPREELSVEPETIIAAVRERGAVRTTYFGKNLAASHGRIEHLAEPLLAFARSDEGIPLENSDERAGLIFLLLTPRRMARVQPRLLADIAGLTESEYVTGRLRELEEPEEIIEAIRVGQQVALD